LAKHIALLSSVSSPLSSPVLLSDPCIPFPLQWQFSPADSRFAIASCELKARGSDDAHRRYTDRRSARDLSSRVLPLNRTSRSSARPGRRVRRFLSPPIQKPSPSARSVIGGFAGETTAQRGSLASIYGRFHRHEQRRLIKPRLGVSARSIVRNETGRWRVRTRSFAGDERKRVTILPARQSCQRLASVDTFLSIIYRSLFHSDKILLRFIEKTRHIRLSRITLSRLRQ